MSKPTFNVHYRSVKKGKKILRSTMNIPKFVIKDVKFKREWGLSSSFLIQVQRYVSELSKLVPEMLQLSFHTKNVTNCIKKCYNFFFKSLSNLSKGNKIIQYLKNAWQGNHE